MITLNNWRCAPLSLSPSLNQKCLQVIWCGHLSSRWRRHRTICIGKWLRRWYNLYTHVNQLQMRFNFIVFSSYDSQVSNDESLSLRRSTMINRRSISQRHLDRTHLPRIEQIRRASSRCKERRVTIHHYSIIHTDLNRRPMRKMPIGTMEKRTSRIVARFDHV